MEKKENVMRFKCMAEKGEREREGRKKNRVKHSVEKTARSVGRSGEDEVGKRRGGG